MSLSIRSAKSRLTKARNYLGKLFEAAKKEMQAPVEGEKEAKQTRIKMKHHKLALKIATLKEEKEVVEAAVQKNFQKAKEFDSLPEEVKTTELRTCEDYIASTWDIVGEVKELIVAMEQMRIELQRSLEEESAKGKENSRTTEDREDEPRSRRRLSMTEPPLALSQIQIPTFSGKLEEWDTYWGLFISIVHDQDLPVLRKFAYLLSTLTGEAKEVLCGFQFREENYEVAVQWLKKKYAREEVAIEQLYRKVEEAHAKDATTAAQRKLLDDLSATMMQLTSKGQNVNHREGTMPRRENGPRNPTNRAMVNEIEEDERKSRRKEKNNSPHRNGEDTGEEEDIDVRILLDTGSELSFIDTQLIKDLNLPVVGKSKFKIRTFGQTTVEEYNTQLLKYCSKTNWEKYMSYVSTAARQLPAKSKDQS
ncbi:unnamed protein product [Heligmosomoides polygyrus]|uniref:DUF1758 domain-containing protein n=1 Tax=Heligmosomoides polygyrus TaxID=6339 RepID=A0A183FF97_HELPZ|nr:unnamed protein product [Heligmosomoides polygyrus]